MEKMAIRLDMIRCNMMQRGQDRSVLFYFLFPRGTENLAWEQRLLVDSLKNFGIIFAEKSSQQLDSLT